MTKISKYFKADVDLHSAIPMAVKASAEIIYDYFTESVNRLLNDDSFDGESSSSSDESDSGAVSESDERNESDKETS